MSSRLESCVGMVTGISAEGGREKREGDEERWAKESEEKSRETGKAEVSWVLRASAWNVSLYYQWPPSMSHTIPYSFSYILSHSCLIFLWLSAVTVTFDLIAVCLILLFMSSPYQPMCVCVCGARFHSEILKCLLSALFLSSYSPAAAVIRNRAVNCDSSSQQSSNPILQQYCTHVNWIPPLNRFKFHFYVKYDTRTG